MEKQYFSWSSYRSDSCRTNHEDGRARLFVFRGVSACESQPRSAAGQVLAKAKPAKCRAAQSREAETARAG